MRGHAPGRTRREKVARLPPSSACCHSQSISMRGAPVGEPRHVKPQPRPSVGHRWGRRTRRRTQQRHKPQCARVADTGKQGKGKKQQGNGDGIG